MVSNQYTKLAKTSPIFSDAKKQTTKRIMLKDARINRFLKGSTLTP